MKRTLRIDLSTGGPADWIEVALDAHHQRRSLQRQVDMQDQEEGKVTVYRVYWPDTHTDYETAEEALAVIRAAAPYLVVIHA